MPVIDKPKAFRVDIIETERGWGKKIDEVMYFDNKPEAISFVENFNSKNNFDIIPDWFMYAEYVGEI